MQVQILKTCVFIPALTFLLFFSELNCSVITYLPQELRECLEHIYAETGRDVGNDLSELCSMIAQNRVLSDEKMVRSAIHEALVLLETYPDKKWLNAARDYLSEYLIRLNERSVLLKVEGEAQASVTMPTALLARSLKTDPIDRDMIVLTSQLSSIGNIELCGSADIAADFLKQYAHKSVKPTKLTDPSLIFNPNMLTSVGSSYPNVVFGTGVGDPVITAWAMHPSTSIQSPINMQFSIPGNLRTEKAVSIEMHFLVKKQFLVNGNARIRINALYVNNNTEFPRPEVMTFTNTTDSSNFTIVEPTQVDDLMHVYINVPIEKSGIEKCDFAIISLSRIYPEGLVYEYAGDIYLAAAVFRYTPTKK